MSGLEALIKTAGKFPKIPDIRQAVLGSVEERTMAEAEAAWQSYVAWVDKWYTPDQGVRAWQSISGVVAAPKLDPRTDYASRSSGGYGRVWNAMDTEKEVWVKRDFIEAWKRFPTAAALGSSGVIPEWAHEAAKRIKEV